ncbi:hypothetical protein HPB48_017281 [Haemaphysalis longicornis]|uniref:RING-type domain-containing protein n=1 Tax=Haemaphysalis longicornis TaxID=44386 RepID=A0A9J6FUF3_HAELO|nr:hypothetical protein HPB48_017281 [Haemaphysalis longicornis]
MAHGRQKFALVGYSEDLEKRPLKFADPIPASRICSACGNIPRMTYTLVCGHTFCDSCCESCTTASECMCPLDGDVCDRDAVARIEYPAEQLLRRKVHCWNEANGCGVVLAASQVTEHVRHDCQHHVTHCPTCSATVLCRDVCAHLNSRCAALVLHAAPEPQQGTNDNEIAHLVAFERKVEQRVDEMDAKLAKLSLESGLQSDLQSDKLAELCHNINHLNETLRGQLSGAAVQTLDCLDWNEAAIKAVLANEKTLRERTGELDRKLAQLSLNCGSMSDKLVEVCSINVHLNKTLAEQFKQASDRNLAEMKALYVEKTEYLRTALNSELALVPSESTTDQRVMTGYAALKEKAAEDGGSSSMSDRVYLHRYLMCWGIEFIKEDESLFIGLSIQLHEGREDEFREWPFRKDLMLSIIHPETRQELLLHVEPSTEEYARKFYCRPIDGSNPPVRFRKAVVNRSDIESYGYVKRDQLLLRFEVI